MYIRLLFYSRIVYNFGMSYLHLCVYCFFASSPLMHLFKTESFKRAEYRTLLQKVLTHYFIN